MVVYMGIIGKKVCPVNSAAVDMRWARSKFDDRDEHNRSSYCGMYFTTLFLKMRRPQIFDYYFCNGCLPRLRK